MGRDLAQRLDALYDSEINLTITRTRTKLANDRYVYTRLDFAFVSCMEYHDLAPGLWLHVDRAAEPPKRCTARRSASIRTVATRGGSPETRLSWSGGNCGP
jgi:hypothetical protein